jgi:hypothetical protein
MASHFVPLRRSAIAVQAAQGADLKTVCRIE